MTIYDLLRELIKACARNGTLPKSKAFQGVDLVNKLEILNAFGTQATIQKGEDNR